MLKWDQTKLLRWPWIAASITFMLIAPLCYHLCLQYGPDGPVSQYSDSLRNAKVIPTYKSLITNVFRKDDDSHYLKVKNTHKCSSSRNLDIFCVSCRPALTFHSVYHLPTPKQQINNVSSWLVK